MATAAQLPEDLIEWRKELKILWLRVWVAVNKALALLAMVGIHKALDMAASWLIPADWANSLKLLRGTFLGVFAVIYLHFLWEMLVVFVPQLKKKQWRKVKADASNPAGS